MSDKKELFIHTPKIMLSIDKISKKQKKTKKKKKKNPYKDFLKDVLKSKKTTNKRILEFKDDLRKNMGGGTFSKIDKI
tara:strand:- start:206 stop:439 length:234 start_codon:yes stop_codon:yes gene_type:complete